MKSIMKVKLIQKRDGSAAPALLNATDRRDVIGHYDEQIADDSACTTAFPPRASEASVASHS